MVWFQCEDCGENLKKPKLLNHFNRCSAYKKNPDVHLLKNPDIHLLKTLRSELSCIDCGVIFDQKSVQAHTSCVSEVEKYGPKGLNKSGNVPSAKPSSGKGQTGPDVDVSRGLSTFPPWSCSLCNVKATSRETLELHAQGKKHRSRAKAATLKENNTTKDKGTDIATDSTKESSKDESQKVEKEEAQNNAAEGTTDQVLQKKRKKAHVGEARDPTSELGDKLKLEKRAKQDLVEASSTPSRAEVGQRHCELLMDSQDKKRKHEGGKGENLAKEGKVVKAKKSKKKDKLVMQVQNGHGSQDLEASLVATNSSKGRNIGCCVELKNETGTQKTNASPIVDNPGSSDGGKALDLEGNGTSPENGGGGIVPGLSLKSKIKDPIVKQQNGSVKSVGKLESLANKNDSRVLKMQEKVQEERVKSTRKKDKNGNIENRESIVHEVSFREWLGEEGDVRQEGIPAYCASEDLERAKETLQQLQSGEKTQIQSFKKPRGEAGNESTQGEAAKIVKWKRLIKKVLGKSVNGKMKRKDLEKVMLPLAMKAAESTATILDRKSFKAELMRQVNSCPKFVLDGKHVLLASNVK